MTEHDRLLLHRWLVLIARLRDRDAIDAVEAGALMARALEAVAA